MKLGVNLGYWGIGQRRRQPRPGPRGRPARLRGLLGRRGLRLRRGHRALLGGSADRADRRRLGDLPDPGPHPRHDRDDRRDPRLALRRPLPARPRRLRTAGLRGLARRRVRGKPLGRTREYVEIVRWPCPASGCSYQGEHFRCRCPDGPGKAPQADRPPGARAHPDLPRRGRPEEPRADRRDRGRLAGHLLRPRQFAPEQLDRDPAPAARRPARRWTASTSCPTVPIVAATDGEPT